MIESPQLVNLAELTKSQPEGSPLTTIQVSSLSKSFFVPVRDAGLKAALVSLVNCKTREVQAVKNVNFMIEPGEMVGFWAKRRRQDNHAQDAGRVVISYQRYCFCVGLHPLTTRQKLLTPDDAHCR